MEDWKQIKGYEGVYEISSLGRVKSLPRLRSVGSRPGKTYISKEKMLTLISKDGYMTIRLYLYGLWKRVKVHKLVAEAFLDKVGGGTEVNHKDFDKSNNCVGNLEWCSRRQNIKHAFYGGRGCKLTKAKADEIRASNKSRKELSDIYGVGVNEIDNILRFKVFV